MSGFVARLTGLAAAVLAIGLPAAAPAQQRSPLTIGTVRSTKTCTLYREYAGRSAMIATPWAIAAASSWQSWLVKDCVDNFASLRMSLEAAFASSGKFAIGRGGYVVNATLSDVSGGGGGPAPDAPDMGPGGYSVSSSGMFVNIDITVRDRAGRIVYGGLLTKRVETGSDIKIDGFETSRSASGEALYGVLQHEVALAAARLVAFKLVPLRVIGGDGQDIQLNYGAPLLKLGTNLQVTSRDGGTVLRYLVTSASADTAHAEPDGDGDRSRIDTGATAIAIEADDPAANGRRMKRVELP